MSGSKPISPSQEEELAEWLRAQPRRPKDWAILGWVKRNCNAKFDTYEVSDVVYSIVEKWASQRREACGGEQPQLPGFGLPLDWFPKDKAYFPVLFGKDGTEWAAATLTIREVCMLKLIDNITDKPEWWTKVRNPEIADKWKKEALELDWTAYRSHADFTPAMSEACITELLAKAELYEKTGLIPVYDYSACALKSDTLLSTELRAALKAAVAPLEEVAEDQKDWHPGSNKQVLDLVHPSLWPLLYGRSRILTDKRMTVQDCLEHCGMGVVLPEPHPTETSLSGDSDMKTCSMRFQWLPCDVDLSSGGPKISSYINNLHPVEQAHLYPVIESLIERALPAWDVIWRWPEEFKVQRLKTWGVGTKCTVPEICRQSENYPYCTKSNRPIDEDEDERVDGEEWKPWYDGTEREERDLKWLLETHRIKLPDVGDDAGDRIKMKLKASDVKSAGFFGEAPRIQVIVKLANIHLTPENPRYKGGSWHSEGQVNEHICSTALFYYDSDNITDCHLDFRTPANGEDMPMSLSHDQYDYNSIDRTFAIQSAGHTLQDIGSVLTREGRALFFPNVYQHHVSPFRLADPTRPGHRKILALFLVDPAIPVISTAHVPPQQRHWWAGAAMPPDMPKKLPREVVDMVVDNVDFPIAEDEAKELRLELMEERTRHVGDANKALKQVEWNFCEH